ncbi:MAG: glyceraldehyde-3-phosphate dehydrogenase [Gammaproteobacteria bacterium]|nr:MAG: glyceraldehyde-3-phosphate dehydrogenase [Gammaproteobacteria bacterium]
MNCRSRLLCLAAGLLGCVQFAYGDWRERFIDPEDGKLDASEWLATRTGFLPVPIIITEPAVGYGGGVALAFFHGQFRGTDVDDGRGGKRRLAPSVSVVAAGGTENGTRFIGGGHLGIWKDDNIRYIGGIGYADVNMDYYGRGGELGKRPVHFDSKAFGLLQELQFRLGDSPFFAGFGYRLVDTRNRFDVSGLLPIPGIPAIDFDSRSAGVSLSLKYDTRDNIFTPNEGLDGQIEVTFNGKAWGGDDDFTRYAAFLKYYRRLSDDWVLGLRGDAKAVDGDAPFYEYPFVEMRGIKVMRYQGEKTLLGEAELRWFFTPRWALVGFGGAARTFSGFASGDSDVIYSKGLGIRYLIARKLGLQAGIDLARGPEDTAIYFQVGSAWMR